MTTTFLGTFKKTGAAFTGTIQTLAWKAQIDLLPIEGSSEGTPAYRVYHKEREIGAAWVKRARKSDQEFLSLKVRDLAFGPNPVYPALVQSTRDAGSWNLLLNGNGSDA